MPDDALPIRRPPTRVPPADVPGINGLLALTVGVVVVAALYLAREVLIPITLAVLLSFLLAPCVALLRRLRLGRVPSVLLAVLFSLCVILAVGGLIGTQVADLARDLPRYQTTIEQKAETIRDFAFGRMSDIMRGVGHQFERATRGQPPAASETPAPGTTIMAEPAPIPVEVHQPTSSPFEIVERILAPVLSPLSTTAIVFVFATFILLQREDLRNRLIRLFGSGDLHRTTAAMDDAAGRLSRYFLFQLAINLAFGVIVGTGLLIIGVPSPVLWGVLGALLRFVPYIGSFLAAALPLALAAAVDPGWSMVLWTAALYLVVEPVMGQVVEPLLYGHSTGLSPFAVVVAATFWTWLWGPIGLILSTPLTLLLVVLGRHAEPLEFLDVLLGDRPPLTPVENFYQRMLAGDPDEAQDQAELLLKERSLTSYYDEVALKGLQLAANDLQRGVVSAEQLERIKEVVQDLVQELADHEDKDPHPDAPAEEALPASAAERSLPKHPPPALVLPDREQLPAIWRGDAPVLCLAGRGPLDEAASSMLAQLLRKHGLGARVAPHQAAARGRIDTLDVTGVAMVCISYLEIRGNPSHLRYLLRRLHQRLPRVPVLVGLWPAEDEVLKDAQLRTTIGATYYTTTLHDAVQACLQAAQEAGGRTRVSEPPAAAEQHGPRAVEGSAREGA